MGQFMWKNYWVPFAVALLQASMGRILGRTKENLCPSDVAVALARPMLLDALSAAGSRELPPGSALAPQAVHLPNAFAAVREKGQRWEDIAFNQLAGASRG